MNNGKDIPRLIESTVPRTDEHIVFGIALPKGFRAVVLIAPAEPYHAEGSDFHIEWMIGSSSAEERKWRGLVLAGLGELLAETDMIFAWPDFRLALQGFDPSDDDLDWELINPKPFYPFRCDWDFSTIPDDELIACCLWEYGRESFTFAMLAKDHWLHQRLVRIRLGKVIDPAEEKWEAEEQKRIEMWFAETGYDYDAFHERYWETDFPLIEIYETIQRHGGTDARAWQSLSLEARQSLIKNVGESLVLRPVAPALVGELESLWTSNSGRLLEIRAENRPPNDDYEDSELFSETHQVEIDDEDKKMPERTTAAFTIDFSRFTDREILHAFGDWLKNTRPEQWKRPRRVFPNSPQPGRKLLDYRVALERLALMRLLHDHDADSLRQNYPDVWKALCRDDTHFRRECKLACDFFRTLFPFLPEGELPRTAKPLEVWDREIEEKLAREKANKGLSTGTNS